MHTSPTCTTPRLLGSIHSKHHRYHHPVANCTTAYIPIYSGWMYPISLRSTVPLRLLGKIFPKRLLLGARRSLIFPIAILGNSLRGKSIGGVVIDGNAASFVLVALIAQVISIDPPPFLKKAAWTNILQSTLVLGMWESAVLVRKDEKKQVIYADTQHFLPMFVSFLLGCIGTITGTLAGYTLASSFPSINKSNLAVFATCLTASFIGGTVNFFEVAVSLHAIHGELGRSLEVFAASDIGFMVVYFGALILLQSSSFGGWILPRQFSNKPLLEIKNSTDTITSINKTSLRDKVFALFTKLTSITGLIIASLTVTILSSFTQLRLGIPGISVICTVLLTLGSIKLLNPNNFDAFTSSTAAGNFMLSLFYATIGLEAGIFEIFRVGAPILVLILTSLSIHISIVVLGSYLWNKLVYKLLKKRNLDMIDVENVSLMRFLIDIDTAVVARYEYIY